MDASDGKERASWPPPRGPLRSSAGDAAAISSKPAQAAVTRPARRRAAAGVTVTRSESAVICGNGRRHSGAANAVAGPAGTRSTTSKATVAGKLTLACPAAGACLYVLTLTGDRICATTRFDNSVLLWFGQPRSL